LSYDKIEVGKNDVDDICMLSGTVTAVDSSNNQLDVDFGGDVGELTEIDIFYHCQDNNDVDDGYKAFAVDDEVLAFNNGGGSDPEASDLKIVGFADGVPRLCRDIYYYIKMVGKDADLSSIETVGVFSKEKQTWATDVPLNGGGFANFPIQDSSLISDWYDDQSWDTGSALWSTSAGSDKYPDGTTYTPYDTRSTNDTYGAGCVPAQLETRIKTGSHGTVSWQTKLTSQHGASPAIESSMIHIRESNPDFLDSTTWNLGAPAACNVTSIDYAMSGLYDYTTWYPLGNTEAFNFNATGLTTGTANFNGTCNSVTDHTHDEGPVYLVGTDKFAGEYRINISSTKYTGNTMWQVYASVEQMVRKRRTYCTPTFWWTDLSYDPAVRMVYVFAAIETYDDVTDIDPRDQTRNMTLETKIKELLNDYYDQSMNVSGFEAGGTYDNSTTFTFQTTS